MVGPCKLTLPCWCWGPTHYRHCVSVCVCVCLYVIVDVLSLCLCVCLRRLVLLCSLRNYATVYHYCLPE